MLTRTCLKESDGRVTLSSLDLPDPGPGQVIVRTTMSTICGSDVHIVDDLPVVPAGTPMGHEGVGIIEAVGPDVERFRRGDRVVSSCLLSCGGCVPCLGDEPSLCATFGAPMNLLFGAQGEAFLVPGADHSLARIPTDLDDRRAILAADVLSTGFGAVERAGVRAGTSVAVFAQGPVGLCATVAAKFHGAEPIIAVESVPERAAMARRLGADYVVPAVGAVEEILKANGGRGVDVAIEAIGKQETFESCCRVVRLGGVVSSVGVYVAPELRVPTDGSFFHRTIVTTFCPAGRERLEYLLRLMQEGRIDPSPMFTHTMALSEIAAAYDLFRSRSDGVMKIAIV